MLTKPVLIGSAIALAVAATAAAFAAGSPSAQSGGLGSLLRPPAASSEAAPAAAVVSEVPFSSFIQLVTCNSNNTTCFNHLPRVPPKQQLAIQFVSCTIDTAAAATFRDFSVQVTDAASTKLLGIHFIAPTYQSDRLNGVAVYVASQPMVLTVKADSILYLVANAIGSLGGGRCAVSGVRQTLG
jgi:hypothetical protein